MVIPWDLESIGGVNAVVANLYDKLVTHGRFNPTILIKSWSHKKPEFTTDGKYNKIRMRIRPIVTAERKIRSFVGYLVSIPREFANFAKIIRDLNISVINAHYPSPAMLTFAVARYLNVLDARLVLSFHGTDMKNAYRANFFEKLMWRWLLFEADAIVACSTGLANLISRFESRVKSKIYVVHNGIDSEQFTSQASKQDCLPKQLQDKRIIISIGTFNYNKGHDLLLKAFSELIKRYNDIHLILIGQPDPDNGAKNIQSIIEELGLRQKCILLKNQSREAVAGYLRIANLFVLASRSEAFGLVFLEAGAFGVPVVGTRVGGIPEIISKPEYGLLVPPDDSEILESAIEFLLENPGEARKMGFKLRKRVEEHFSWEEAYMKYEFIFDTITANVHS